MLSPIDGLFITWGCEIVGSIEIAGDEVSPTLLNARAESGLPLELNGRRLTKAGLRIIGGRTQWL
jgi:hypothetical protein